MYAFALLFILLVAGCAKNQTKETMTAKELGNKAASYIKTHQSASAIPYLEELISRFPEDANVGKYKILLAELHFKEENYTVAKELYNHFSEYYPSDKQAEYAKYKTILSAFNQTLPADCDQSYTEETIKQCKEYMANPTLTHYRTNIESILNRCNERLAEKEIYVFNFYLGRKQFEAAHSRLNYIKKAYAENKSLEPRLLYLEYKLASKEKNTEIAQQTFNRLHTQHPESRFTAMADSFKHNHSFML